MELGVDGGEEMSRLVDFVFRFLSCVTLAMTAYAGASAAADPARLGRCLQLHQLWMRYETANCPNQSGQRAQAEWALSRCQADDFDRGFTELERLLRRNLIPIPSTAARAR